MITEERELLANNRQKKRTMIVETFYFFFVTLKNFKYSCETRKKHSPVVT